MGAHKVLVLGNGGREHAIACKMLESESVCEVFVCPGNAGMEKLHNMSLVLALDAHDHTAVATWCKTNDISLVIVGPENLLAEGICDSLIDAGIPCFGPRMQAAKIESSKEFAKQFMSRFNLPTAKWQSFTDAHAACNFIRSAEFPALVVKASGLAAGKGVVVAKNEDEACQAAIDMLQGKFGNAGKTVVIEELLEGEEVSCLAFSDGTTVALMPAAQDHKRLENGDQGPNTGGMGAYCPCTLVEDMEYVRTSVLQKTVDCLQQIGCCFVGVLYAGLILTRDGPKLLEFNCRFGDPETQVILPLLKSDLFDICMKCVNGELSQSDVEFCCDRAAVGVVLASSGYPASFQTGFTITGIEDAVDVHNASVYCAGVSRGSDDGSLVTSGGRVLTVVVTDCDVKTAAKNAQHAVQAVNFTGKTYRTDIALKALRSRLTYASAGVNITAGDQLIHRIKSVAKATRRRGCDPDLGQFGGVFDIKLCGYVDPVLVSGTDGVGTKLQISQAVRWYDSVGIDLVAMSVNDVLCHAAEPLFFLDCFSCSKLDVDAAYHVVSSISRGCQMAGCALIGGETAEMPGTYKLDRFEVSGFVVGAVERGQYLPQTNQILAGDVVIGLPSSGLHSNGFSLVRAVVDQHSLSYDAPSPFEPDKTLGRSLLTPTRIYVGSTLSVMRSGLVKAAAHITGGGLPGNIVRVLPDSVAVHLDASLWTMPPVFGWISHMGGISTSEMSRTFNCGIGFVLISDRQNVSSILSQLHQAGEPRAAVIGSVVSLNTDDVERVKVTGLSVALKDSFQPSSLEPTDGVLSVNSHGCLRKKRVAVLISGSGTNLQALLDHTSSSESSASVVLVVSNVSGVMGLDRAKKANVDTVVVSHKDYKSREEFDSVVHQKLIDADIDIVCLAGFMRILTGGFVQTWCGRMLNIHPSLLPSFRGAHPHRLALEAGVMVTGCTVHFVTEDVDCGAILLQEAVTVVRGDTEETLSERVLHAEHRVYPRALELLASGAVTLDDHGKVLWC